MLQMGYAQDEIQDSLINQKYDEIMATYLLLDYRNSEVCSHVKKNALCVFKGHVSWNVQQQFRFASLCVDTAKCAAISCLKCLYFSPQ